MVNLFFLEMDKSLSKIPFYIGFISLLLIFNIFLAKNEWHLLVSHIWHGPQTLRKLADIRPFFNPLVDMDNFAALEMSTTFQILEKHIQSEKKRIDELRKSIEEYSQTIKQYSSRTKSAGKIDDELNPLTSYLLIKQLILHWDQIKSIAAADASQLTMDQITSVRIENKIKYPDTSDLLAAAVFMINFQQVYKMSTSDFIEAYGKKNIKHGNSLQPELPKVLSLLNVHEYFTIGQVACQIEEYKYAKEWLQMALEHFDPSIDSPELAFDINESLAYVAFQLANVEESAKIMQNLLAIAPGNHTKTKQWLEQMNFYMEMASKINNTDIPSSNVGEPADKHKSGKETGTVEISAAVEAEWDWEQYKQLCREDSNDGQVKWQTGKKNATSKSNLLQNCFMKMDRPFLKLAPHKIEILHLDPLIVLCRNFVSNAEMEMVKHTANPLLTRATVISASGEAVKVPYRIAKSVWLRSADHPLMANVGKRIEQLTNLDLNSAFDMRVLKYGIGAHHLPHFDFTKEIKGHKDPTDLNGKRGNRVATCLIWLNEPIRGGRTIFTELGLSVAPSKGDALFWYNLKMDGQGDFRTKHAGCPVQIGEKWIMTKLINERGQEWIRPCPLTMDEGNEKFLDDLF